MCIACEIKELIEELESLDKRSYVIPLVPVEDKHAAAVLTLYAEMIKLEQPEVASAIQEVLDAIKIPKTEYVIKLEEEIEEKLEKLNLEKEELCNEEQPQRTLH